MTDKIVLELDIAKAWTSEDTPTVADALLFAAARQIVTFVIDREQRANLERRVERIADEELRLRLAPMIEEALKNDIRFTNEYGEPKGNPMSLRDAIVQIARDDLAKARSTGGMGRKETLVEKLIREEVSRTLDKELRDELAAAKAQVREAVKTKAAEVLTETLRHVTL